MQRACGPGCGYSTEGWTFALRGFVYRAIPYVSEFKRTKLQLAPVLKLSLKCLALSASLQRRDVRRSCICTQADCAYLSQAWLSQFEACCLPLRSFVAPRSNVAPICWLSVACSISLRTSWSSSARTPKIGRTALRLDVWPPGYLPPDTPQASAIKVIS